MTKLLNIFIIKVKRFYIFYKRNLYRIKNCNTPPARDILTLLSKMPHNLHNFYLQDGHAYQTLLQVFVNFGLPKGRTEFR